jgi:hypothetical protein
MHDSRCFIFRFVVVISANAALDGLTIRANHTKSQSDRECKDTMRFWNLATIVVIQNSQLVKRQMSN